MKYLVPVDKDGNVKSQMIEIYSPDVDNGDVSTDDRSMVNLHRLPAGVYVICDDEQTAINVGVQGALLGLVETAKRFIYNEMPPFKPGDIIEDASILDGDIYDVHEVTKMYKDADGRWRFVSDSPSLNSNDHFAEGMRLVSPDIAFMYQRAFHPFFPEGPETYYALNSINGSIDRRLWGDDIGVDAEHKKFMRIFRTRQYAMYCLNNYPIPQYPKFWEDLRERKLDNALKLNP